MNTKLSTIAILSLILVFPFSTAFSQENVETSEAEPECNLQDADGDGYFAFPDAIAETRCKSMESTKGYETPICDCPELQNGKYCPSLDRPLTDNDLSGVFDAKKYKDTVFFGEDFNPGMPDTSDDYIDQDCDGYDKTQRYADESSLLPPNFPEYFVIGMFIAGVSLLMVVAGGIMYLISSRNFEKKIRAKKILLAGFAGIAIVLLLLFLIMFNYSSISLLGMIFKTFVGALFFWGLFRYFTSGGHVEKQKRACGIILLAIIGIVLSLISMPLASQIFEWIR